MNSLPRILLGGTPAYLPLNLSQPLAPTRSTLQSPAVTSRTPAHLLTLQHVVQSVGAVAATADRCYSAEDHWGCDGQHAEGDVNLATGVHHPTNPTRGLEDPPWVWTVSHSVPLLQIIRKNCIRIDFTIMTLDNFITCVVSTVWKRLLCRVHHLLWVNRTANLCPPPLPPNS